MMVMCDAGAVLEVISDIKAHIILSILSRAMCEHCHQAEIDT